METDRVEAMLIVTYAVDTVKEPGESDEDALERAYSQDGFSSQVPEDHEFSHIHSYTTTLSL